MVVYRSPRGHPDSEFVEGPDNQTLYRTETDTSRSLQAERFQQQTSTPDAALFQKFQTYCKCSRSILIPAFPGLFQVFQTYIPFYSDIFQVFQTYSRFSDFRDIVMCSRLPGCYKLITDITNLTQSQITVFLNTNAFLRIIIEMTPEYACAKITEIYRYKRGSTM